MSVVNGLPAHVLLVHAVVVLLPLAALLAVVTTLWPAMQRRLGVLVPALAVVAAALVPVTTEAGEWLERHVEESDLVERHATLGDGVLPWAAGLAVVAVGAWLLARWAGRAGRVGHERSVPVWARVVVVLVTLVVAAGTVVQVVRAGDSGARAAWHDAYTQQPTSTDDD